VIRSPPILGAPVRISRVDGRFAAFVVVSTLLIVTPGPDMALVTRSALRSGQRAASLTAFGVGSGILMWGLASVLGLAVLLDRSALAFTVLKLVGAAYLVYLGVRTFLAHSGDVPEPGTGIGQTIAARGADRRAFLQGLLGNVLNPKAGVVFVTVIPQFIHQGDGALRLFLMLAVFEAIIVGWLNAYGYLVIRSARGRAGSRIRGIINRVTGLVLIGLAARVAIERS
jgi:threonine/homoserine/homoserine lactone efflux protein